MSQRESLNPTVHWWREQCGLRLNVPPPPGPSARDAQARALAPQPGSPAPRAGAARAQRRCINCPVRNLFQTCKPVRYSEICVSHCTNFSFVVFFLELRTFLWLWLFQESTMRPLHLSKQMGYISMTSIQGVFRGLNILIADLH